MFIYFVGLILASYVRSVWQKDDVLRKKVSYIYKAKSTTRKRGRPTKPKVEKQEF